MKYYLGFSHLTLCFILSSCSPVLHTTTCSLPWHVDLLCLECLFTFSYLPNFTHLLSTGLPTTFQGKNLPWLQISPINYFRLFLKMFASPWPPSRFLASLLWVWVDVRASRGPLFLPNPPQPELSCKSSSCRFYPGMNSTSLFSVSFLPSPLSFAYLLFLSHLSMDITSLKILTPHSGRGCPPHHISVFIIIATCYTEITWIIVWWLVITLYTRSWKTWTVSYWPVNPSEIPGNY